MSRIELMLARKLLPVRSFWPSHEAPSISKLLVGKNIFSRSIFHFILNLKVARKSFYWKTTNRLGTWAIKRKHFSRFSKKSLETQELEKDALEKLKYVRHVSPQLMRFRKSLRKRKTLKEVSKAFADFLNINPRTVATFYFKKSKLKKLYNLSLRIDSWGLQHVAAASTHLYWHKFSFESRFGRIDGL